MPNETSLYSTSEHLRAKLTLISDPSFNIEVVSFEGHESTISPYNIKIVTYHDGKRKDMYNLINLSACFTIDYLGEKKVHHGIIKRVTSKAKGRFGTIFTFTLQPRFALLSDNRQYRIFHHQSVPEIIQAIFTANAHIIPPHGYELRLVEKKETHDSMALYEKLTYCVQYGESDAQFLLRIMSEWGLGFYFEQDTDANIERVIITNGFQHAQLSYPHQSQDVPYEYNAGGNFHRGAITRFSTRMSIYPEATQLNHYRDASPSWPLRKKTEQYHPLHTQRIRDKSTFADFHRHQEPEPREFPTLSIRNNRYRYTDLSEKALTYLTHTAQASQTTNSMTIEADTSHVGLNACMSFTVDGVDDKRIEAKTWLVTEVHFQGSVTAPHLPEDVEIETGEDYFCELRAVPLLSNTYRLPQQFPTPRAYPDTAIVVGDHNGQVQTDNHNRVKVQFTWSGLNDQHQEETSTYVRVSQLWAGDGFGAQFTPRVGDEVLVLFLGDSPNYPFIGGSLYNPKRLYPNKANQYLSGFVSQTPNRQGSNSILFNDTNGKEQIEITTTGNKIETIEKDHTVNVDGSQKMTIGQNQETTINESQHTHIKQNQETKVEGSQITKVTGDVKITSTEGSIELYSKKTSIIESDDSIYLNAKKKIVLRAGTGITLKVGSNHITLDPASLTTFPMMGLSGEVPPFASVAASLTNLAEGKNLIEKTTAAVTDNTSKTVTKDNTDTASTEQTASSSTQEQKQKKTLRIGVFFDGTGNNQTNDEYKAQFGDQSPTNVARLFDAYPFVKGESYAIYVSGIGTVDGIPIIPGERNAIIDAGDDLSTFSQATGVFDDNGAFHKWQSLLEDFSGIIDGLIKEGIYQTITHVEFDVFGFSRGASLARHFINAALAGLPDYMNSAREQESLSIVPNLLGNETLDKFAQEKQYQMQNNERVTETRDFYVIDKQREVSIGFVGLFDTVGSFYLAGNNDEGSFKLGLESGCANTIYQICAHHEYRKNFPLTSVGRSGNAFAEGNVYQEVFPGCHSDIGGGYPSKNQYGRQDLPKRLGQPVNSTYYRECVERVSLYEKYNSEMYRISSDYEIDLFIDEKLAQENLAWENICQTQYGAKGEVKYDDGKFYYYRLMPIDNALSGLAFERMKQQGELHGIKWNPKGVTYPQDYANDPHIIKPLWENLKNAPLGTIDVSLWQASEAQLLSTSIHRSHGVTSPGYGSFTDHLANEPIRDRNGNLVRGVFANE